jgi:hypothetical protein
MNTPSRRFAVLTGCWLLAACVQPSAPTSEDSKQSPAKSPATLPDKAAPSQPAPSQPAPMPSPAATGARAYVSVDGVGLHVLDGGGWRLELETRAPIRDMLLLDGQLFVLSAFGVQRVAGGQAQTVAEIQRETYSQIGDPLALASADGQTFWVAGPLGVARYSGSWALTPVAASNPTSIDVALDRTGLPYLAFGSLFRHQDASWQPLADASNVSPLALLPDPRSDAMLVHGGCQADLRTCVVLRATADAPPSRIEFAADECTDYGRMAVSADGTRAAIAGRCGLVRFGLDGEPQPVRIGITDGWPGQPLRSLALDAGGRLWAGTHNSLMIIAADGAIEDFPIGQLGDIAGPVGPLLVEGDGPPPPTLGRARNGDLTGVFVVADGEEKRPLPGVTVELCSHLPPAGELVPDPARSPCAGVESTHTTTTDGDGRFAIGNIPIGHYYFGVEIDGRWARGQPKALNMRAGMNGNVGKITVAVPE